MDESSIKREMNKLGVLILLYLQMLSFHFRPNSSSIKVKNS